jgi:hypothetical protein
VQVCLIFSNAFGSTGKTSVDAIVLKYKDEFIHFKTAYDGQSKHYSIHSVSKGEIFVSGNFDSQNIESTMLRFLTVKRFNRQIDVQVCAAVQVHTFRSKTANFMQRPQFTREMTGHYTHSNLLKG